MVHKSNTKKKNDHISKTPILLYVFECLCPVFCPFCLMSISISFSLFSFFSPFLFVCFMSILSVLSFLSFSISVLVPYLCVYFRTFCVYLFKVIYDFILYTFSLIFVLMCEIFCIILFYSVLFSFV